MPAPIVYEVTLSVEAEAASAYAEWLRPHIAEILRLAGFVSAEWFEVESEDPSRVEWCVHYRVASREALQAYFDEHAARLRGAGLDRFRGRFTATRRILNLRERQG